MLFFSKRSLCSLLLLFGLFGAAQANESYSFGVVPQGTATKLAMKWIPVLDWLSNKSGVELRFETAPDIPTFEQRVSAGEYDFAYMNPYHFVVYNESPGYHALAHANGTRIKGIVVVPKSSSVQTLADLQNKTLAYPSPAAFAATLVVRSALRQKGIQADADFVKSHDSVYINVAKGLYPAGGGIERTLALTNPEIRKQLRVLWVSPGYTPHAIASRPGMSESARTRIKEAMAAMNDDPKGREILKGIGFKGFESAADKDWDDIRSLKIDAKESGINR